MKKLLLTLALVSVATRAFAQFTTTDLFTFTPSTQVVSSNSSFTIQVGVTGSAVPSPLDGFDLWLVTSSANSGLFSITNVTYAAPFTFFTSPSTPDAISTPAASGFVRNSNDLGNASSNSANDPTAPYNNTPLATITISTGALSANTTYTFFSSTSTNAGSQFSDLIDQDAATYETAATAFNITTVPEPSTWFAGIGALGVIGHTLLRGWRRTA
jgi:hypothetical protein